MEDAGLGPGNIRAHTRDARPSTLTAAGPPGHLGYDSPSAPVPLPNQGLPCIHRKDGASVNLPEPHFNPRCGSWLECKPFNSYTQVLGPLKGQTSAFHPFRPVACRGPHEACCVEAKILAQFPRGPCARPGSGSILNLGQGCRSNRGVLPGVIRVRSSGGRRGLAWRGSHRRSGGLRRLRQSGRVAPPNSTRLRGTGRGCWRGRQGLRRGGRSLNNPYRHRRRWWCGDVARPIIRTPLRRSIGGWHFWQVE